jgi:NAD(P)-dependent dehydrogenase (short-subunit alcohol dehydrogenase family)
VNENKRWFITGVSSGFGRLLAEAALARGDSVVGTLRNPEQAAAFEALAAGRAHAVLLDVTDRKRIPAAVAEGVAKLGGIDILVNNAGYGLAGALEELEEDEIDHEIETNLGGTIYVTKAALPALRESRGRILNLSSMAGLVGLPGMSVYCAAKHGVEGLSESLSVELAPFGIKVTLIEPGGFSTNFLKGSERVARAPLALYDGTPGGMTRSYFVGGSEFVRGDPAKAVAAILLTVDADEPPLRLVLGADALKSARAKLQGMNDNLSQWEHVTLNTAFDNNQNAQPS